MNYYEQHELLDIQTNQKQALWILVSHFGAQTVANVKTWPALYVASAFDAARPDSNSDALLLAVLTSILMRMLILILILTLSYSGSDSGLCVLENEWLAYINLLLN